MVDFISRVLIRIKILIGFIRCMGLMGVVKTIVFNLEHFPFHQALHLPVLMSGRVCIKNARRGSIIIEGGGGKFAVLRIGLQDREYCYNKPSFFSINGKLVLKGNGLHSFAPGAQVYIGRKGVLSIDEGFTASHDLKIYCTEKISVGKNNMWSYYIIVMDNDGHHIYDQTMNHINVNKEVVIGDDVWIGGRCTVQKGSVVPHGCIIGSDSIVRKALATECAIYAGNGPLLIKRNIKWDRELV